MANLTFTGWIIVALYAVTTATCALAASTVKANTREKQLWLAIATVFLLLGAGRLFDLQTVIAASGRMFAFEHGWYWERRPLQQGVIVVLAIMGMLAAIALIVWARGGSWLVRIALAGTAIAVGFALIRAVSLHQVDMIGASRLLGLPINWILELGAIALVLLPAFGTVRGPLALK